MNRTLIHKLLALVCAAGVLVAALAACGGAGANSADSSVVTLRIWQGFKNEEVTIFNQIMKEFQADWEKKNPGRTLRLELERVSYDDMILKLKTATLAGIAPDIAFVDSIKVTDLALGQAIRRIDQLPNFRYPTIEAGKKEFVEASYDAGIVNRKGEVGLYGLPVQTTTVALFWNRKMFRERARELQAAGLDPNRPPADWREFVAYGKVLTNKEKGVFGYGASSSLWWNFPIFNMYGVQFIRFEEGGRVVPTVNSPNAVEALNMIREVLDSGIEGGAWRIGGLGPDTGFINERYAMILMGPWFVEKFQSAGMDFDIGLIPAPPADVAARLGIPQRSSSNVGGQTGVVMRSSPHAELAYDVLEHFTSAPAQKFWAESLGQIPVRRAAWDGLNTEKFPYIPKFMAQLALAKRIPPLPLYQRLENDIVNPTLNLFLNGQITPEDMLKNIEINLEARILSEMRRGGGV